MIPRFRRSFKTTYYLVFFSFFALACRGQSEDFLAGVRGGLSPAPGLYRFQQVEAFGRWKLPWQWRIYSECYLRPAADISAGTLWNEYGNGFVGTLGPALELHFGKFPVELEGGSSPTVLSRNNFGRLNFGDRFQFTSHIGIQWEITKHFTVDWRYQHMSNAGIAQPTRA
jgi:hypothetical protein